MKVIMVGECPVCSEFLKDHPTLDVGKVRRIRFKKHGSYYHTSKHGRMLHRVAIKQCQKAEE